MRGKARIKQVNHCSTDEYGLEVFKRNNKLKIITQKSINNGLSKLSARCKAANVDIVIDTGTVIGQSGIQAACLSDDSNMDNSVLTY
ncbi:hypothetical protein CEXT_249341 [Caerostris extrusa]|uniref:Uncharacterized protein n=1 Tax=Caerostris extrusa TaxID=172846 RepID=A0AAV4T2N4_CAEEX|nr:hypothetical protein CEXT_249341 [Caerostris extrusa]